jgi:hypothetical protein
MSAASSEHWLIDSLDWIPFYVCNQAKKANSGAVAERFLIFMVAAHDYSIMIHITENSSSVSSVRVDVRSGVPNISLLCLSQTFTRFGDGLTLSR